MNPKSHPFNALRAHHYNALLLLLKYFIRLWLSTRMDFQFQISSHCLYASGFLLTFIILLFPVLAVVKVMCNCSVYRKLQILCLSPYLFSNHITFFHSFGPFNALSRQNIFARTDRSSARFSFVSSLVFIWWLISQYGNQYVFGEIIISEWFCCG